MATNAQLNVVTQVKGILDQESVKARFKDVLGKKSSQFMASIVNSVSASAQLKQCSPNSIMASAYVAASFDLPIDSNLGFAALVPYNNKKYNKQTRQWEETKEAQFQIMTKGFVQLAIRSGEYEKMSCSEVYEDELVSYNPITGECSFVDDFSACHQRMNGESDKVIGYYAWFQLLSGFKKELYMSKSEVVNHANKYSQAYRYDRRENKKSSVWSTDFDAMARKTVLKRLLSKWGILSIDMQRAIIEDQKVYDDTGNGSYEDNQPDVIEAENPFEVQPVPQPQVIEAEAQPPVMDADEQMEFEDFDITK